MIIEPNSSARPPIGAILTRPKEPFSHSGIYLGQNTIFENTHGGARFSTWEEFSQGRPVTAERMLLLSSSELWRRARIVVAAKREYGPLDFNCDDAVNLVAGARVRPSQVAGAVFVGLVAFGVARLLTAKSR